MTRRLPAAALVAAGAVLGAAPALYAWAVRRMLRHNLARLKDGDCGPLVRTYADDVTFVFPGQSSWAGEFHGREEVARWLRRFVRVGLQLEPEEILVAGPPWQTIVALRYSDQLTAPDGTVVYRNRGVIFARIAWGRLTSYEVSEDTQRVAELDAYLAAHEPVGAVQ